MFDVEALALQRCFALFDNQSVSLCTVFCTRAAVFVSSPYMSFLQNTGSLNLCQLVIRRNSIQRGFMIYGPLSHVGSHNSVLKRGIFIKLGLK